MSDELRAQDEERRLSGLFASVGAPDALRGRWQDSAIERRPRRVGALLGRVLIGSPGERRLRPLAAALLVPVVVVAVAGGFGLHAQLSSGVGGGAADPEARAGAAMAFDALHGDVVMFGGVGRSGPLRDTWTWDGGAWSQAHPSVSPPAMLGAVMADDPATGRVLLVGEALATAGPSGGQTWSWDGSTWRQEHPVHAPGGGLSGMASDPATHQVVLATMIAGIREDVPSMGVPSATTGGTSGSIDVSPLQPVTPGVSVWTWDGRDWTSHQGPSAATGSVRVAWDESSRRVLLLATGWGCTGGAVGMVSPASGSPGAARGPVPLATPAAGWSGYASGTVAPASPLPMPIDVVPPTPRPGSVTLRPVPGMACSFSSAVPPPAASPAQGSTLWAWDGAATHAASLKTMPVVLGPALLVEDPVSGGLLVGSPGAWWSIAGGSAHVLTAGATLAVRSGAALAADPAHHQVVVFGGQLGAAFSDETWTWDGKTWTRRAGSPQSPPTPMVIQQFPGQTQRCDIGDHFDVQATGAVTTYRIPWATGPCATQPVVLTLLDSSGKPLGAQGNPIQLHPGPTLAFTWSNWCRPGRVSVRLDWPGALNSITDIPPPACADRSAPSILAAGAGHPGVTVP